MLSIVLDCGIIVEGERKERVMFMDIIFESLHAGNNKIFKGRTFYMRIMSLKKASSRKSIPLANRITNETNSRERQELRKHT